METVYVVEDYNFEENHIFSTLDKAKDFCYRLAENKWEDMCEEDFEEKSFDKELVVFNEHEDCIYVECDCVDVAIITPYELDKD